METDAMFFLAVAAPMLIALMIVGAIADWYYRPPAYLRCAKCRRNNRQCSHKDEVARWL